MSPSAILFTIAAVLLSIGIAGAQQVFPIGGHWEWAVFGGFGGAAVMGAWGLLAFLRGRNKLEPDLRLDDLVKRILGDDRFTDAKADSTLNGTFRLFADIRDKARLEQVRVWGRKNTFFSMPDGPLAPIPADYWDHGEIDALDFLSGKGDYQGETKSFPKDGSTYIDIRLNKRQAAEVWPKRWPRPSFRSPVTFK